eukprot:2482236-Prymnesium_polylepis.1
MRTTTLVPSPAFDVEPWEFGSVQEQRTSCSTLEKRLATKRLHTDVVRLPTGVSAAGGGAMRSLPQRPKVTCAIIPHLELDTLRERIRVP